MEEASVGHVKLAPLRGKDAEEKCPQSAQVPEEVSRKRVAEAAAVLLNL